MTQAAANPGRGQPGRGHPGSANPAGAMSDEAYNARLDRIAAMPEMGDDNIRLPAGQAAAFSGISGLIGLIGLALTVVGAFVANPAHALAAFEVGLFTVTAACLGSLAMVMIFHALNAGWSSTVRRTFENIASLLPFCWAGVGIVLVIELITGGTLLTWLRPEVAGNHLIEHKSGFLNEGFLVARYVAYGLIWTYLSWRLTSCSREQDRTGDRWLTRKMRYTSGWGLLAFALSCAFFAFDFLMAQDFRFFSTMWGVYYFAIGALAAVSLAAVVLAKLRFFGRLTGVVTPEHFHDLGKLVFAFTCFWAYIAFSQYFLIWYSNIPEESAWYVYRMEHGWKTLFVVLAFGHFVVPFILFVSRIPKRSTLGLAFFGAWMLVLTVLDVIFIIRPMVYTDAPWAVGRGEPSAAMWWIDVAGIVGVFGVFGFGLIRKLGSGPLVPTKDPYLNEALAHKNYV